MKILSIGNSFSQDALKWLHLLAEKNGEEIETANLYIGGCTLEMHWNNVLQNRPGYSYEINGNRGERSVSIYEALTEEQWDVVTIQQASPLSGRPQSYFPYAENLAEVVKSKQPKAKLYFLQTWSYEKDAQLSGFSAYDRNQKEMFRRISDATEMIGKVLGIPLIYAGKTIQRIRETVPEFDYEKTGLSLTRDGFHLSLDYGRFAAAAVMFCTLTGKRIESEGFLDFDPILIKKITETVESVVFETE